jgi:hypothetical protein
MALTLLGSKQLRLIVISASLIVICNFSNASLNVLLKTLHTTGSVKDRENFFLSMVGVRRRMERKWQETPLAKIFTVPDMFTSLKHQALSIFIVESLKAKSLTVWEAFTAFDHDNNGLISPFSSCVEDRVCLLVEVVEAREISVSFFKPNLLLLEVDLLEDVLVDDAADDLFLKFINDS